MHLNDQFLKVQTKKLSIERQLRHIIVEIILHFIISFPYDGRVAEWSVVHHADGLLVITVIRIITLAFPLFVT